tara:strand:+ start:49 stop:477 length:429 start_codon:yes stop_codon:yes gene_type:complete
MASNLYNPGLEKLLDGTISFESDTINVLLVDASHTFDKTHEFVSDIVANEASGTGYARKTLANAAIALDAANDRVEFDADNPSYTALDAGTIAAAIIFKQVTNDADSPLIAQIDFADLVTNGSDVELQINSEGLFFVTNNIT